MTLPQANAPPSHSASDVRGVKMSRSLRRCAVAVTSILFCLLGGGTRADFIFGNELWDACQANDSVKLVFCTSYTLGVAEAFRVLQLVNKLEPSYCVPPHVQNGQLIDVVKLFLRDHPEKRQYSSPTLIMLALNEKFPCN